MTTILVFEGIIQLNCKKQHSSKVVNCDNVHVKVFKNLENDSSYITGHFNGWLVLNSTINQLTPLHCHGPHILNFGLLNVATGRKGFYRVYQLTFEDDMTSVTFEGAICNILKGEFSIFLYSTFFYIH